MDGFLSATGRGGGTTKTGMRSDFRPHLRMLDSESNREPLGL